MVRSGGGTTEARGGGGVALGGGHRREGREGRGREGREMRMGERKLESSRFLQMKGGADASESKSCIVFELVSEL